MTATIQNLLYFFGAVVLAKIIGALSSFLIPKILAPANYGVWITLSLIVSYSSILLMGSLETLIKQFPFFQGRGEPEKAREIEQAVFGSVAISMVILLLFTLVAPFFWARGHGVAAAVQVGLMGFNAMANLFASFYYYRFTAHQNFRIVSLLDTARSVTSFFFLVFLSWKFGLMGTVAGSLINEVILLAVILYLNKRLAGPVAINLKLRLLWEVIRIGFPITIIWWVFILQTSVDRIIAMTMLGKEATGYYGLGISLVSAIVLIPMVLGRVLYPRINQEVGKDSNPARLSLLVVAPAQALSMVIPACIAILIFCAPVIFTVLFPKYHPGMQSAEVLMLGTFFLCLIRSGVNYLVAINRQNRVFAYVVGSLAIIVGVGFTFVKLGFGITGIAAATGVAGFFLATFIWQSVFSALGRSPAGQLREIGLLYLPFACMGLFISIARLALPASVTVPGLLNAIVCAAVCACYGLILLVIPATRTRLFELYRQGKERILPKVKNGSGGSVTDELGLDIVSRNE